MASTDLWCTGHWVRVSPLGRLESSAEERTGRPALPCGPQTEHWQWLTWDEFEGA